MDRRSALSGLRTGAVALLLACALALALSKAAGRAGESGGWIGSSGDFHVSAGEALVHGVPRPEVSSAMPGFSVPHALLLHHAGTGARLLAQVLGLLAGGLLVFALGSLLHSGLCGAAAALLYAGVIPAHLSSDRWLYTLLVLAAAVALARRAADPTPRRGLLLGLPLGMSLLVMSPLVLFPPVLALYERLRRRPLPPGWAKGMGLLVLACLLPLTLWAAMNWRTHGRLILFEEGRGRHNIYIGALGFVSTAVNPGAVLEPAAGQDLLSWAAREALGHPLRTLAACLRRLAYAASFHPFLYAAALAGAWLLRRREEHLQLALLAGYFIGVHCLMAVEERYFEPAPALRPGRRRPGAPSARGGRTRPRTPRGRGSRRGPGARRGPAALRPGTGRGLSREGRAAGRRRGRTRQASRRPLAVGGQRGAAPAGRRPAGSGPGPVSGAGPGPGPHGIASEILLGAPGSGRPRREGLGRLPRGPDGRAAESHPVRLQDPPPPAGWPAPAGPGKPGHDARPAPRPAGLPHAGR